MPSSALSTVSDSENLGLILMVVCGALFAGASLVAGLVSWQRTHNRQLAGYAAWAQAHGFDYVPRDDILVGLSVRPPFNTGLDQSGHHVFRGWYRGRMLMFGEHRYTHMINQPFGTLTTSYSFQVIAVVTPAPRPAVDVVPNFLPHDPSVLAGTSSPLAIVHNFHNRFTAEATDLTFASTLLNQPFMRWLIADPRAGAWPWRLEGSWLLTTRPGNLGLSQVLLYADFLNDLIDNAPAPVWK